MTVARLIKRCFLPLVGLAVLFVFYGTYLTKVKEGMRISWHGVLDRIFFVVAVALLAYWVTSVTGAFLQWYGDKLAERTHTTLDDDFMPLMRKLAGIIIWVIAFVVILNYLGVSITAMLATLGVGSLAIALAAQDTIANVIAGFLIVIDRPFRVGDRIMLPSGEKVVVLRIGNRRSKFRAEDGSIVIVPNVDLSKSRIVNFTYGERD
jgi:MscS family membrane protein